jgi:uncharacterized protein
MSTPARPAPPRIDLHVHIVGMDDGPEMGEDTVFYHPEDNQHWFTRILYGMLARDLRALGADADGNRRITAREYLRVVACLLAASEELDMAVLLALDARCDDDGVLDPVKTDLRVPNLFAARAVRELNAAFEAEGSTRRFLFGASVHPARPDWEDALDQALEEDAVLLKLVPSVQNVHLERAAGRERAFYRRLADTGLPLLCHAGPEYSYPEGLRRPELDDYHLLRHPLEQGVTVIAAHCATPVFPVIDRDDTIAFADFLEEMTERRGLRLFGDTSAFSLATRVPVLPRVRERIDAARLLNGSDFPIPIDGWAHSPLLTRDITADEHRLIASTHNPFDRDVRIKRAHGFPDAALTAPAAVLRRAGALADTRFTTDGRG